MYTLKEIFYTLQGEGHQAGHGTGMGELTAGPVALVTGDRQVGEGTGPDARIAADGFSCRHQIADWTGREGLHVARVLAMSLDRAKNNFSESTVTKETTHG